MSEIPDAITAPVATISIFAHGLAYAERHGYTLGAPRGHFIPVAAGHAKPGDLIVLLSESAVVGWKAYAGGLALIPWNALVVRRPSELEKAPLAEPGPTSARKEP